jgi:hypothetical protein
MNITAEEIIKCLADSGIAPDYESNSRCGRFYVCAWEYKKLCAIRYTFTPSPDLLFADNPEPPAHTRYLLMPQGVFDMIKFWGEQEG